MVVHSVVVRIHPPFDLNPLRPPPPPSHLQLSKNPTVKQLGGSERYSQSCLRYHLYKMTNSQVHPSNIWYYLNCIKIVHKNHFIKWLSLTVFLYNDHLSITKFLWSQKWLLNTSLTVLGFQDRQMIDRPTTHTVR